MRHADTKRSFPRWVKPIALGLPIVVVASELFAQGVISAPLAGAVMVLVASYCFVRSTRAREASSWTRVWDQSALVIAVVLTGFLFVGGDPSVAGLADGVPEPASPS